MKYTGDSLIGVSLSPNMPKPLDARLVVDTTEELFTISPKIAYLGMPVIHAGNGTIYVLTDKSKINSPEGWTASYESILIYTCTEQEYKLWESNTINYKPIDINEKYIHEGTYYYIYEDSIEDKGLYYVSQEQHSKLEETVKSKASNEALIAIVTKVSDLENFINLNNLNLEEFINKYDSDKEQFLTIKEFEDNSPLNLLIQKYYDSLEIEIEKSENKAETIYVKKTDISGNASDDDYIFVSKLQYSEDKELIESELNKTIKTNEDGSLNSITVNTILDNSGNEFILDTKTINNKPIAFIENIPVIKVLTESEYKNLTSPQEGVYYMTHGDENNDTGYVERKYLEQYYVKLLDFNNLVERVKLLELRL